MAGLENRIHKNGICFFRFYDRDEVEFIRPIQEVHAPNHRDELHQDFGEYIRLGRDFLNNWSEEHWNTQSLHLLQLKVKALENYQGP